MRSEITFLLNGRTIRFTPARPDITLLNWLRLDQSLTGSKEGCGEGDCGACTVFVRKRSKQVDGSHHDEMRAVNACILFLPMLDGAVITTIEGIGGPDGALHPVQQTMIDHHGAQCGFCTPGFVMSLYHMWRAKSAFDDRQIDDGLAGNLCRCTGYGPIVSAAKALNSWAAPAWEADRIAAEDAFLTARQKDEMLALCGEGQSFFAPTEAAECARLYATQPEPYILSGGTDIGLWVTKQHRTLSSLIYTGQIAELHHIEDEDSHYEIGAGITHQRAMDHMPEIPADLYEIWRRFGSAQVRATGTVCGNIANGSPIGDLSPCFLALAATVRLQSEQSIRDVSLDEFFISYDRQNRSDDEFVRSLYLPKLEADQHFYAHKISKRFDQDISAVMQAMRVTITDNQITDIRLAFGGMAATPKRALATETSLIGLTLDEAIETDVTTTLAQDFTPLSDMRASAHYRMTVAAQLIKKSFIRHKTGDALYLPLYDEVMS